MIVFGDRARSETTADKLDAIRAITKMVAQTPAGVARHDLLVAALIEAGELAQGVSDAEMQATGADHGSPLQHAAMALVLALARRVGASWATNFAADAQPIAQDIEALAAHALPSPITVRQSEGYAYYALYPEAFFEAGRSLPPDAMVIGLRSIGTSLAAMVAAGAKADVPISLRPVGHPFRRDFNLRADLLADLTAEAQRFRAIVDEGPGLSGSSIGGLADLLERHDVPPERIIYCPGHRGALGKEAAPHHRRRWEQADRRVVAFEILIEPRLPTLFEDLTGPAIAPLVDLSGGRWRAMIYGDETEWPPVHAMQERRKFMLRTASGDWLLKFVGLGRHGRAALERAKLLHGAGYVPEPRGVRLGFLLERWESGAKTLRPADMSRVALLRAIGAYLGFRARTFAAPVGSGADLKALAEMTPGNIAEALGEHAAAAWRARYGSVDHIPPPRPVATDNRLHPWEWLRLADRRLVKTDAVDHHDAHDLIGCQDIAWDVAGAWAEFDLSMPELEALAGSVEAAAHLRIDRALLDWLRPAYLAFQIGYWTMALDCAEARERPRIRRLLKSYRAKLMIVLELA